MWILFKQSTKDNNIGDLVDIEKEEAEKLIQKGICSEVSNPHSVINKFRYIERTKRS